MIRTLLIANRGEIACRIARTARRMGVRTVAVFSDADAAALHVALADEAVRIGPAEAAASYLDGAAILEAARRTGADAVHPGYGFLSENPDFAASVEAAGLVFVGPAPASIRAMGLKDEAKRRMEAAGVPVVPGYHGERQDAAFLAGEAARIGYPVLVKARAGGGGKGMRRVDAPADFEAALEAARREALAAFGDGACLVERFVASPRHVEVQVFGDAHGSVVHLFERDCSLQRRHQKVLEEAPAPGMTPEMRAAMGAAAVRAARAVEYRGAGTVEFIADASEGLRPDRFFFMEMNTRLQVEHPVTEAITRLDLVELQLRVAAGEPLPFRQEDLAIRGHAFEARLYAESPARGFLPATGRLSALRFPAAGARVETGVREGDPITRHYDPMIAKLVAHGDTRAEALGRLRAALAGTLVSGVETNLDFLARLCADPDVAAGAVDTGLIERRAEALTAPPPPGGAVLALAALAGLGHLDARGPARARFADPFETLRHFRAFGRARRGVALLAEDGARLNLAVTHEGGERYGVETPEGTVAIECRGTRDDGLAAFLHEGRLRHAFARREGAEVVVRLEGATHRFALADEAAAGAEGEAPAGDAVAAPMPGLVTFVGPGAGDVVAAGETLVVIEAMKMEHALKSPREGRVAGLLVAAGDQVESGAVLLTLEPRP